MDALASSSTTSIAQRRDMTPSPWLRLRPFLPAIALVVAVAWFFWPGWLQLAKVWNRDPQYSHGYLVPLFALVFLWLGRDRLTGLVLRPSGWAIPVVLTGVALRLLGAYYYLTWLDQISVLPVIAGVCLASGGWPLLRWASPAIVFLVFMVPLPGRLEGVLALPLQRLATAASTNVLQTLGFSAQAEGTVILLDEVELGIVEACNGIRMLMTFMALSTAVAFLTPRSPVQKIILLLSAVPIALACNVARIVVTGILYETAGDEAAQFFFHSLAGWLMIPLALACLAAELWLLSRLFRPVPADDDAKPRPEAAGVRRLPAAAPARADLPRGPVPLTPTS
jgi:exosortase